MQITYTTTSVGLSTVACLAVILACIEYSKKHQPVLKSFVKITMHIYHQVVYLLAEYFTRRDVSNDMSPKGSVWCFYDDIKIARKVLYLYILALSSSVIIMALCGSFAKSHSLVLQMSAMLGAFLSLGASLLFIGFFLYPNSIDEEKNQGQDVLPTLGLTFMSLVVVSYVFNCGLSA